MGSKMITYETLSRITDAVSSSTDLEDVSEHIVHSLTDALAIKGCALLMLDRASNELKLAAANGLSRNYLEKGPISATKSIADSLSEGPVAITDVEDDPRIQYPEEAVKEGIKSILNFPIVIRGKTLGTLRLYSAESWEPTIEQIAIMQSIALIIGLIMDNLRVQRGLKSSLDVLKVMHKSTRPSARTLYE